VAGVGVDPRVRRTRLRTRRSLLALLAAVCLTVGVSACGGGTSTGNTSGAPAFTVPTGTAAVPDTSGATSTTRTTSSNTSTTGSSGSVDTTANTTASAGTTPQTTPATTPATTPQTTPAPTGTSTSGGASSGGTGSGSGGGSSTTGGAGLGSFCKNNPGAC